LRLHLGCGAEYWPGYVNVDADPAARCDVRLDFTRVGAVFAAGSVVEVAMMHSLSYLRLWQARDLFRVLHRLMAPGGRLAIELPDLAKCARRAMENEGRLDEYLEGVRGLYAFSIHESDQRHRYTPYAFGWTAWHLRHELEQAGFRDIRECPAQTHDLTGIRDIRVEAVK
jgi:hypothetical protein